MKILISLLVLLAATPAAIAQVYTLDKLTTYAPGRVHTTSFAEKGEAKINTTITAQKNGPCIFSADLAYAFSPHMAAGVTFRNRTETGYSFEGQMGYFTTMDDHWSAEGFVGYANGRAIDHHITQNGWDTTYGGVWGAINTLLGGSDATVSRHYDRYDYSLAYHNLFAHAAISYNSDHFSLALGAKFSYVDYYGFRSQAPQHFAAYSDEINEFMTTSVFAAQPFVNMEWGWKYAKFCMQTGTTAGGAGSQPYLSLGMNVHIAPRFR